MQGTQQHAVGNGNTTPCHDIALGVSVKQIFVYMSAPFSSRSNDAHYFASFVVLLQCIGEDLQRNAVPRSDLGQ